MSELVRRKATNLKQVRDIITGMDEYLAYLSVTDFAEELISRIEGRQSDLLDIYMMLRNFRDAIKEPKGIKDVRKN